MGTKGYTTGLCPYPQARFDAITLLAQALPKRSVPPFWKRLAGVMLTKNGFISEAWLAMKPGITCIWQISGRNDVEFEDWMRMDLEYIDNWSLWLDVKILLKTIPAVLLARGR